MEVSEGREGAKASNRNSFSFTSFSRDWEGEMARLFGTIVAPRGRMRRRARLPLRTLAALLLLLLLAYAAAPIDADDADDKNTADENNPRALFERSYFQLPAQHLREAARADLGGVEFDWRPYSGEEKKNERGETKRDKKRKKGIVSAEEKTTSTSTSASAAAAAALPGQAAADLVKVMVVQPNAQQMEAIMRGEQVK